MGSVMKDGDGTGTYGTGLKNEVGEYNCCLNSIIQSLWHLIQFRNEFLWRTSSNHVHVCDPCVICALYDIFIALKKPSKNNGRVSNLNPASNFFPKGQTNDASEVLEAIFDCFHRSFPPAERLCPGSCIAHYIFGLNIVEKTNCSSCGLESTYRKYKSFFHKINVGSLRTMKVMYPDKSFEELLYLVQLDRPLACKAEAGGCRKLNYAHPFLSTLPLVFATVLVWESGNESVDDIKATLAVLSTEIDISVIYRGLHPQARVRLVSVVCYCRLHYLCLTYSHDQEQWILHDDRNYEGNW